MGFGFRRACRALLLACVLVVALSASFGVVAQSVDISDWAVASSSGLITINRNSLIEGTALVRGSRFARDTNNFFVCLFGEMFPPASGGVLESRNVQKFKLYFIHRLLPEMSLVKVALHFSGTWSMSPRTLESNSVTWPPVLAVLLPMVLL